MTGHDMTGREDPTERMGAREEPTSPAEPRTGKLPTAPWLSGPDPIIVDRRPPDPFFWPAVIFVAVLLASIGVFLYTQSRPHQAGSSVIR